MFIVSPNASIQFHGGRVYWLIQDHGSWASVSAGHNKPEQDEKTNEWFIPKAQSITTLRYNSQKDSLADAQVELKLRTVVYTPPGWLAWKNGESS